MAENKRKIANFWLGVIIIVILFVGGAYAYQEIEGYTFVESFYYVVLTITTVGAFTAGPNTIQGLWLSVFLVLTGMGVFLYIASQIARIILEGRIRHVLGRIRGEFAKMRKEENHIIVCGYTNLGKYVTETLVENDKEYVVVEQDQGKAKQLSDQGEPILQGNPLNEDVLKKANIEEAEGLVATLEADADNIYLLMSAKDMNPDMILAGKASTEEAVDRLHKVGAQIVVRPDVVGGKQLANSMLKIEEAGELETLSTED